MKSNAIAHFEALTREKDAFDQATMQADRERSRIQARLQELGMRKEHFELESRKLSDAVGQFDNRKKDYTNEKARLKQVIQQERIALEQCAKQTEDALAQERARKRIFCQEMTSRNDELSRLLLQREDMRLSELIHVQTVAKIQAQQNTNECRTPTTNKEELEGAIEKLSDATNRAKSVLAEKKMLEGKVQELRRLALERATNAAGMNAGDNANSAMVRPIQVRDPKFVCGVCLMATSSILIDSSHGHQNTI